MMARSFPGLAGDPPRAFYGRGEAAAPPPPEPGVPDFTLSNNTVTTSWGVQVVGELVPNADTPPGAYFVLLGNPAGLAVENG